MVDVTPLLGHSELFLDHGGPHRGLEVMVEVKERRRADMGPEVLSGSRRCRRSLEPVARSKEGRRGHTDWGFILG